MIARQRAYCSLPASCRTPLGLNPHGGRSFIKIGPDAGVEATATLPPSACFRRVHLPGKTPRSKLLKRTMPTHHHQPINDMTFKRPLSSAPQNSASRRSAIRMMNGSCHDANCATTSTSQPARPKNQPSQNSLTSSHPCTEPRKFTRTPSGSFSSFIIFFDLLGHAASLAFRRHVTSIKRGETAGSDRLRRGGIVFTFTIAVQNGAAALRPRNGIWFEVRYGFTAVRDIVTATVRISAAGSIQ